jgi:hypothetical protein
LGKVSSVDFFGNVDIADRKLLVTCSCTLMYLSNSARQSLQIRPVCNLEQSTSVHSPDAEEMRMSNTPRLLGLDKSTLFLFTSTSQRFPTAEHLALYFERAVLLFNCRTSNSMQISANCIPAERKAWRTITRPFPSRAGDAIHPVLQKLKGLGQLSVVRGNVFHLLKPLLFG